MVPGIQHMGRSQRVGSKIGRGPDNSLGTKMRARQAVGETVVVCVLGPRAPYCNLHITMEGIQHRLLFWQQMQKAVEGLFVLVNRLVGQRNRHVESLDGYGHGQGD